MLGGCSIEHATAVRNIGIGVTAEGALVTAGSFVTRDSDEGISDAVITAAPLFIAGIVGWVVGEISASRAAPASPR